MENYVENEKCWFCKDTGWIDFPASRTRTKEYYVDPKSRYYAAIPCICNAGRDLRAVGYSKMLQDAAVEYIKDKSSGVTIEDRKIMPFETFKEKVKEFMAQQARRDKEPLTPEREWKKLRKDFNRTAMSIPELLALKDLSLDELRAQHAIRLSGARAKLPEASLLSEEKVIVHKDNIKKQIDLFRDNPEDISSDLPF